MPSQIRMLENFQPSQMEIPSQLLLNWSICSTYISRNLLRFFLIETPSQLVLKWRISLWSSKYRFICTLRHCDISYITIIPKGIKYFVLLSEYICNHQSLHTNFLPSYIHYGHFQLEFVSISQVLNHMTCYKFECSHWWKIYLKKSFTRFALQSECCNFNQWEHSNYNRSCDL